MSKVILGLIVAAAVVTGGALLIGGFGGNYPASPQSSITPSVSNPEEMAEVVVTDEGFSPQQITIKAGTRVVWRNSASQTVTVNSALHPTHQEYPPLNLGEFAPGSTVSLIFDKTGTYRYHNHLNSTQFGVVIVE